MSIKPAETKPYATFPEFFNLYMQEHSNDVNRYLHFAGTTLILIASIFRPEILLALMTAGEACAISSIESLLSRRCELYVIQMCLPNDSRAQVCLELLFSHCSVEWRAGLQKWRLCSRFSFSSVIASPNPCGTLCWYPSVATHLHGNVTLIHTHIIQMHTTHAHAIASIVLNDECI